MKSSFCTELSCGENVCEILVFFGDSLCSLETVAAAMAVKTDTMRR